MMLQVPVREVKTIQQVQFEKQILESEGLSAKHGTVVSNVTGEFFQLWKVHSGSHFIFVAMITEENTALTLQSNLPGTGTGTIIKLICVCTLCVMWLPSVVRVFRGSGKQRENKNRREVQQGDIT